MLEVDPYVYEGTYVLKNKFGITLPRLLAFAEKDETSKRIKNIDTYYLQAINDHKKIDFDYYKGLHKYIFENIYDWAGNVRIIDIEKSERVLGGDTIRYCYYKDIEKEANKIINKMDLIQFAKMPTDERSLEYSKYIAALWKVHPFREGNTRTTMIFASHYAESHGFHLKPELFKFNAQYTRNSLVVASDGMYANYDYINKIMQDSMNQGDTIYCTKELNAAGFKETDKLIKKYKDVNRIFGKSLSVKEIHNFYKQKQNCSDLERKAIKEISDEFKAEELKLQSNKIKSNDIEIEP